MQMQPFLTAPIHRRSRSKVPAHISSQVAWGVEAAEHAESLSLPGQSLRSGRLSCLLASSILLMWKVVLSAAAFIDSSRPTLTDGIYEPALTHTRLQFLEHSHGHTHLCALGVNLRGDPMVLHPFTPLISSDFYSLCFSCDPPQVIF